MAVRRTAVLSLALLSAALAACGDDDGDGVSTAGFMSGDRSPTAQATAQPCPVSAQACTTGERLDQLVENRDIEAIATMGRPASYTCPGSMQGEGGPYPLCDGARAGEMRSGFQIAVHGSQGAVESANGLRTQIARAVGGPSVGIASIGCVVGRPNCGSFIVAFSTGGVPQFFYFAFDGSGAAAPALVAFGVGGDNWNEVLHGGQTMTALGEAVFYLY